jgi:glycerol-3-phosphate dehydrogenase
MDDRYDVIVIGGGVNGTGVLRDLALRGIKAVLFERNDIAFGASGNSTGMIHGGPRYLTMNPEVTYTSCLDSGYIQSIAPHLLFRAPILLPVTRHRGARQELDLFDAFFDVYDRYQPLKRGKPHTRLKGDELKALEPGLLGEYEGAVTFDEWGIDGARLCVANARDAANHGADVFVPYSVSRLLQGSQGALTGVDAVHRVTGRTLRVHADLVVNATGAWGPLTTALGALPEHAVRLRPGKGIHLFFDRRLSNYALMVKAVDGRLVFIEPWQNTSVIGTTDDDYYGDLDNVFATTDEARYLLEAIARVFPAVNQARLIGTYAGVRPTLYEWGKAEDKLSREHEIVDHARHGAAGLYSMIGGKLASYRIFAEEMTDRVCQKLGKAVRCTTMSAKLPGGEEEVSPEDVAEVAGIDTVSAERIVYRHGAHAMELAEQMAREPKLAEVVCACEPVRRIEIHQAVEHEWAFDVDSVSRRTRLGLGSCGGLGCAARCGAIVAELTEQSPAEARRMAYDFLCRGARQRASIVTGPQLQQEEILRQYTRSLKPPSGKGRARAGNEEQR